MSKLIKTIKGTRDFYPEEMTVRTWIYDNVKNISESYGYQEYEGPFLESIELYAAKSGDELVKEQSFVFPDRGGDLVTLRPELTPTLARMVAQRQRQLVYPVRWWSFGPFWRYERPQKGRSREFFQWNIDLFGVDTPQADAELIAIAASFFNSIGLKPEDVQISVNNRRLVNVELAKLDIDINLRPMVIRWIDRRPKMDEKSWYEFAGDIGISPTQITHIQAFLDDEEHWKQSPELIGVIETIDALGFLDYIRYDPNIVRGLDYYTGTVFEAHDTSGDIRRSILGGGRYDDLLSDVGGTPLPGVGFAMGDMVIRLILDQHGLLPDNRGKSPDLVLVTVFDQKSKNASYELMSELHKSGVKISCYPKVEKLGKQFKYADRVGIRIVLVLGPDEIEDDQVTVKDLYSGHQRTVDRDALTDLIKQMLDADSPS
ncbi:MAG: histidine--tRNA ligase [Anaerolineales bacterium]|jgi:histidyl-tRNA synthetase